jgi:hypothetical protein
VDSVAARRLWTITRGNALSAAAGRGREVWFFPRTRMPMGLAVGAVTIGGRLHLVFRYRYPLFGQAEVTDFAERYLAALDRVTAAGEQHGPALTREVPHEVPRASAAQWRRPLKPRGSGATLPCGR